MGNLEPGSRTSWSIFPGNIWSDHRGQTKAKVINDGRICAFPGWSVGLAENTPVMPEQGQGKYSPAANNWKSLFSE